MIDISPTAAAKITELLAEENKEGSGLRVFVQGGGCSGFQYGLMIEEAGTDADQVYEFERGRVYNLDGSRYIAEMQSLGSGAHNDIAHPEVAHAMWSAVLL